MITATLPLSGVSAVCNITVTGSSVTSIDITETTLTLNAGDSKLLTYKLSPTNNDGNVAWTSAMKV